MIRHAYERADFEVRKAKRPDFYAALGVMSVATEGEIKSEYRQKALVSKYIQSRARNPFKLTIRHRSKGVPPRQAGQQERRREGGRREEVQGAGRHARDPHGPFQAPAL